MQGTILVLGATGKTGTPLVQRLQDANVDFLVATRNSVSVRFDWLDKSTYANPFEFAAGTGKIINRVYLVAPQTTDMFPPMKTFIDLAKVRGVRRFVLLSATVCEPDLETGLAMGKVHAYLATLGEGVQYCVLRPSWFMENFATQYVELIRERHEIVSATGTGRLGYVSTEDIADVAFDALMHEGAVQKEEIIVGPQLVTYDEIAQMLTEVVGRKITHKIVSKEEMKQVFVDRGMPEEYAEMMTGLDGYIAQGGEEKMYARATVVGKRTLKEFFVANKAVWIRE
ncbi:NAD(P)-bd-dom domain-containing protein [Mycena chlorophos]|uniref:NAD(P)-bd-dom domain-containing protein n=1 Tax=Mycena chlorophos TaxID=658473 RepID=A0A8H6WIL0_MYCCL|nr:NAD(P)-bd-dom domain-containing protein [Mycena chlorophos]